MDGWMTMDGWLDEYMTKCNKVVFELIELLTNLQFRRVRSFACDLA